MSQRAAAPHNPIQINPDTCIRCMICDYVCPGDVIHKKPRSQELPVIKYPDECWYCGMCEQACPASAITVIFPESMLSCQTPVRSLLGSELADALPKKARNDPTASATPA